jgi:hypothetical protein
MKITFFSITKHSNMWLRMNLTHNHVTKQHLNRLVLLDFIEKYKYTSKEDNNK